MADLDVTISLGDGVQPPVEPRRVEAAVRHVLVAERVGEAELSVALVGDAQITAINARYLGHERPTDVISFSLNDAGEPPLGDVYVGVDQARRQAAEHGASEAEEVLRLAVHGTLHALGWDHPEDDDRAQSPMYRRQESLLAEFLSGGGA